MSAKPSFENSLSQMDKGYLFGPVPSRRLGRSIGINLFPSQKTCNFRCIYCECDVHHFTKSDLPRHLSLQLIQDHIVGPIADLLISDTKVAAITFAGNGEPTLHSDLLTIYQQVHLLRARLAPQVKIVLLTNGSRLTDQLVNAFTENGDVIQLKFDAATPAMYDLINDPKSYPFSAFMHQFKRFGTTVEVQTMCLYGSHNGQSTDILAADHWSAYLNCMKETKPRSIHLYSLQRPSISSGINGVPIAVLQQKQHELLAMGISAHVYGN